jgi:hypothetical protein
MSWYAGTDVSVEASHGREEEWPPRSNKGIPFKEKEKRQGLSGGA